jgi:hypothetical protein
LLYDTSELIRYTAGSGREARRKFVDEVRYYRCQAPAFAELPDAGPSGLEAASPAFPYQTFVNLLEQVIVIATGHAKRKPAG